MRTAKKVVGVVLVSLAALTAAPMVLAQPQGQPQMHGPNNPHGPGMPGLPPGHAGVAPHGPMGRPAANPHGAHAAAADADDAIEHAEEEHEPGSINWIYGFAGVKEGVAPSILWRPKEMPVPFGASIINFAILAGLAFYFGKKPLAEGLAKRKETLMREIDEAAQVKAEAQARYDEYKAKLGSIDSDVERIKKDALEAGVRDRERLTKEAADKRVRMKRDAEFLLEQEGKLARAQLLRETVATASLAARALLSTKLTATDQDRLADEHVKGISRAVRQSAGGAA